MNMFSYVVVVVWNMFNFHTYLGKWSKLTNIFQLGWNHQTVSRVEVEPPNLKNSTKSQEFLILLSRQCENTWPTDKHCLHSKDLLSHLQPTTRFLPAAWWDASRSWSSGGCAKGWHHQTHRFLKALRNTHSLGMLLFLLDLTKLSGETRPVQWLVQQS